MMNVIPYAVAYSLVGAVMAVECCREHQQCEFRNAVPTWWVFLCSFLMWPLILIVKLCKRP